MKITFMDRAFIVWIILVVITVLVAYFVLLQLSCEAQAGEWIYLQQTEIRTEGWGVCRTTKYIYESDRDWLTKVWVGNLPVETVYVDKSRGCGVWLHPVWDRDEKIWINTISSEGNGTLERYYFYGFPYRLPRSVWVPKPCPSEIPKEAGKDTSSGAWYWEFKLGYMPECICPDWKIRIRADTLWQAGDSVWIEDSKHQFLK